MGKKKTGNPLSKVAATIAGAVIKSQAPFLGSLAGDKVAETIEKLMDRGFLIGLDVKGLSKMDVESLLSSPKLGDIEKVISNALKLAEAESNGAVEDVLSEQMLSFLERAIRCNGKLERAGSSNSSKLSAGAKDLRDVDVAKFEYQYYVKTPLASASFDTVAVVKRCFNNWEKVCGVVFKKTKDPKKANVIVKLVDIDGRGNILADAHIGPPNNGFQLELRIDSSEVWETEQKFEAAVSHEVGHLIGLRHTNKAAQLMNTTIGSSVTTPQDQDKERAIAIWGKTRKKSGKKRKKPR